MNPSTSFTAHLKALLVGGAIVLSASQKSEAAAVPAPEKDASIDSRVAKIREALRGESQTAIGSGPIQGQADAGLMWWRNAWGNGGWHNWGNGWHNWHNGGWGNWHNF